MTDDARYESHPRDIVVPPDDQVARECADGEQRRGQRRKGTHAAHVEDEERRHEVDGRCVPLRRGTHDAPVPPHVLISVCKKNTFDDESASFLRATNKT